MPKITTEMLEAAAKVDDLDEALRGVMDAVGIEDGGVAGMVFSGDWEGEWPTASEAERMHMLTKWREAEEMNGGMQ